MVVVVRFQGPRANGMPELHKLTPALGVLQDRGFKVALVTDGRMSGASGKVPAAIHVSPEALEKDGVWGPLALLRDGDVIRVSAEDGTLSTSADLTSRARADARGRVGTGRELFGMFRAFADEAELGASAMLAEGGLDPSRRGRRRRHPRTLRPGDDENGTITLDEPVTLNTTDTAGSTAPGRNSNGLPVSPAARCRRRDRRTGHRRHGPHDQQPVGAAHLRVPARSRDSTR